MAEEATKGTCTEPGCERPAAREGRCWGHVKQLQRHGRTFEIGSRYSAWSRLLDAKEQYDNAESDEEFAAAEAKFKAACRAYGCRLRVNEALEIAAAADGESWGEHPGDPPSERREDGRRKEPSP